MKKLIQFSLYFRSWCVNVFHHSWHVCKVHRSAIFYTWVSWKVSWGLPALVVIGISSPSSPESWREPPTRPQQAFWLNPFLNFSYYWEHMKYNFIRYKKIVLHWIWRRWKDCSNYCSWRSSGWRKIPRWYIHIWKNKQDWF